MSKNNPSKGGGSTKVQPMPSVPKNPRQQPVKGR